MAFSGLYWPGPRPLGVLGSLLIPMVLGPEIAPNFRGESYVPGPPFASSFDSGRLALPIKIVAGAFIFVNESALSC